MKKFTKIACLLLALAMAFGCLTACASTGKADDKDVLLGLIGPMTGDYANYGTSVRDGAQIAVDEINAAGGVNGWKFTLSAQDSQGDPDSAVTAYGKLVDDGMDVSIGCVLSGEAASVITAAKEDDYLIVTPSSSAKDCIANNDKAFRVCFNDPNQGTASANYIADYQLGTKIGVLYQSDIDYSAGLYETFKAQAAQCGLEIVTEQTFTDGTKTDFTTQINALKESGCELVFLPFYAAEASTFLTQAQGKLENVVYFGCDGLDGLQTKVSDMSLIEGVMMLTPFAADAEDAATQAFVAEYQKRYNKVPDQFAADGYDAVYAVKAVMEKTGKVPSDKDFTEALVAAMYEVEVNGLTGAMTWDAEREPNKDAKAMVYVNGVAVLYSK
jgi:branched-chain amino acid transport system substrate-binding protein